MIVFQCQRAERPEITSGFLEDRAGSGKGEAGEESRCTLAASAFAGHILSREAKIMRAITAIGFDADDTLWQNEQYYRLTEEHFAALLGDYAEGTHISERLLEAEKRNLEHYGFGIKGFTLSMIETAIEVTGGNAPAGTIADILEIGRELLRHPVETLPHVEETLRALNGEYLLVLITKGDLFDQERKLAQSGLGDLFDAVEIVSDKTATTYRRIFSKAADGPERAMMVGNSLRSDIVP